MSAAQLLNPKAESRVGIISLYAEKQLISSSDAEKRYE